MVHGYFSIDVVPRMKNKELLKTYKNTCSAFIILSQTLDNGAELIGIQTINKVVLVSQSSQWQIYDFMKSRLSQQIVNLLVIADPSLQHEEYYKVVCGYQFLKLFLNCHCNIKICYKYLV